MRLTSFNVHEFRSVWDSGKIEVGDVTCLVGKNEAGKTSLLKALYRIAPIVSDDAVFDATDDYPRKESGDYFHDVESGTRSPASVIVTEFALESDDVTVIEQVFGSKALQGQALGLTTGYSNTRTYALSFDEAAARAHVVESADITDPSRAALGGATSWNDLSAKLATVEATAEVARLQELVAAILPKNASYYGHLEK
jgi:predicted ATP-dependent endonuclease of OLD family